MFSLRASPLKLPEEKLLLPLPGLDLGPLIAWGREEGKGPDSHRCVLLSSSTFSIKFSLATSISVLSLSSLNSYLTHCSIHFYI